jgi:hypothetical protein
MEEKTENQAIRAESPTIRRFLRAFWGTWLGRMSGPPAVPLAVAALFVSALWIRILFAVLAIGCALTASYTVWAAERRAQIGVEKALIHAESTLKMRVQIWKLYLVPLSYLNYKPGHTARFHVFVFAQIELRQPQRIGASDYELILERFGRPCNTTHCDDVNNWQLSKLSPSPVKVSPTSPPGLECIPLMPFPPKFQRGIPADKWLHFTTDDTTETDLHESNVRLIVTTPLGAAYDESDDDLWNHDNGEVIGRKS